MTQNFFKRSRLDQRPLHHAFLKAIANFQSFDFGGKFFNKFIVHGLLHVQAIGTHAGLPGISVFAGHGAFDGAVDVGVVKHNEGRVAAQFQ